MIGRVKSAKPRSVSSNAPDFVTIMRHIPNEVFIRMVMKSGLTPQDSRALCAAHKEL